MSYKGIPQLGSGAIYPVPESDVVIADFQIPDHWPRAYALDVGWNKTAAIWGAQDPETATIYLYSEYYRAQAEPVIHAEAIKARGSWIPGVIDPAARGRSQRDGSRLMQCYQDLGLDLQFSENAVEAGLYDGGVAFTETSTNFAITRVFDGPGTFRGQDAVTGVSLFNPNEEAVTVSFNYLAGNGGASTQGAQQVFREIPARSMIAETASDLFGTASLSRGIITGEVTQGDGVVAFELIQLQNQSTELGLKRSCQ